MKRTVGIAAAFSVLCLVPALAEERITDFQDDVRVVGDGTLDVTETITIISEDARIIHGIYRDLPTEHADQCGNRHTIAFRVANILRDGKPESYELDTIDSGVRLKIGDGAIELAPGTHTYKIEYLTNPEISSSNNYDELYWNVTGNYWAFPIDHARALIHLPTGAEIVGTASYTGPIGSTANNAVVLSLSKTEVQIDTSATLSAGEGLTVLVDFKKGVVSSDLTVGDRSGKDQCGRVYAWTNREQIASTNQ